MIDREEYLNQLMEWKDQPVMKVISGVRRGGKSTLLAAYRDRLLQSGVRGNQILWMDFDELQEDQKQDTEGLIRAIESHLCRGRKNYLFFDEIEAFTNFQPILSVFSGREDLDIYLISSSVYGFEQELSTYFSRQYVKMEVYPCSFQEYVNHTKRNLNQALIEYLKYGGFPFLTQGARQEGLFESYMEGSYCTILWKELENRQNWRQDTSKSRNINMLSLMKAIAEYIAKMQGEMISVRSVTAAMKEQGRNVSPNTVSEYMDALLDAHIFYAVERYDMVNKQLLKANKKWYVVDLGLRNFIMKDKDQKLDAWLEQMVAFQLMRQGFSLTVGKYGKQTNSFIATKEDSRAYYQIAAQFADEGAFKEILKPLKRLKDHYAKVVLTMDVDRVGDYDGIRVVSILDWLLQKE